MLRFHKGSDIKLNVTVSVDLDTVHNLYVIIIDPILNKPKKMSLYEENDFIFGDIIKTSSSTIDVLIKRSETDDWLFGIYHVLLYAAIDDNYFENSVRIDSNSQILFNLVNNNVPTKNLWYKIK